jgi:hypothetical protein
MSDGGIDHNKAILLHAQYGGFTQFWKYGCRHLKWLSLRS